MKGAKKKYGKAKKSAKRDARRASRNPTEKDTIGRPSSETRGERLRGKPEKHKLTARRNRPLEGSLRYEPVVFVKAQDGLDFKVEQNNYIKRQEQSSSSSSSDDENDDCENNTHLPEQQDSGISELPPLMPRMEDPVSTDIENVPNVSDNSDVNTSKYRTADSQNNVVSSPHTLAEIEEVSYGIDSPPNNSDEELLGSMSDSELDKIINKEITGTELLEQEQYENLEANTSKNAASDSEIDSISDYESDLDRSANNNNSADSNEYSGDEGSVNSMGDDEDDSERNLRITLDDYDLSDADSAIQDYMDNMSDLDDDQIFALASGQMKQNSIQDYEDMDAFDKYDEYDEYFDELLDHDHSLSPKQPGVSKRKKEKRQAREVMHAMKFGKQPLLWIRYPEEIHIREILAELRNFSHQNGASLAFPPLDNNANWYVKQLAEAHGMRPTVEGSHFQKYVVAHRTRRTSSLADKGMNKLLNRRQLFRRSDLREDKKKARKTDKNGKPTSARVRNGYVVGQDASQITEENFGHKLLRQMGWQEGHGLGKERAGITTPIGATVKLTKTGLGGI